jgi:Type II secretion system (T2SS), protein M subtype b
MPKSSKLALAPKIALKRMSLKDPRIAMRVVVGALLAANLAMAVVAFKPFGGSADDLRKDQARLSAQLRQLQTNLEKSKQHVAKIEIARTEGDQFMSKYIMDKRSAPATLVEELSAAATDAGVRVLPDTFSYETLEGSDTLQMMAIAAPFEGDYAGLAKLVNVLEKSPRFWIIDEMSLTAPQQQNQKVAAAQQNLNVNLKLLAFVRDESGTIE